MASPFVLRCENAIKDSMNERYWRPRFETARAAAEFCAPLLFDYKPTDAELAVDVLNVLINTNKVEPLPLYDMDQAISPRAGTPPANMLCLDCLEANATWVFLPCRCLALCGRCKNMRVLNPASHTICPCCGEWNKGSFKHI